MTKYNITDFLETLLKKLSATSNTYLNANLPNAKILLTTSTFIWSKHCLGTQTRKASKSLFNLTKFIMIAKNTNSCIWLDMELRHVTILGKKTYSTN